MLYDVVISVLGPPGTGNAYRFGEGWKGQQMKDRRPDEYDDGPGSKKKREKQRRRPRPARSRRKNRLSEFDGMDGAESFYMDKA